MFPRSLPLAVLIRPHRRKNFSSVWRVIPEIVAFVVEVGITKKKIAIPSTKEAPVGEGEI
jgi:hypothetical protein